MTLSFARLALLGTMAADSGDARGNTCLKVDTLVVL